jgi:NADPH:quinone reductase-like Zn-dependent oxidoreductase
MSTTPLNMKAIVQNGIGGPEVLSLQTVPVPNPAEGQVLIRVYAAAVNPIDWKMRGGYGPVPPADSGPIVRILGFDVAGVVETAGSGVTAFKPGDAVVSMIGRTIPGMNGGYAQFTLAPVDNVTAKPENVTFTEAVGLCTAGMTANRICHLSDLSAGERVLITGVAGGVGSLAAQIAKVRGAHVIGTASARHHDFLKDIGVDEIIDYTRFSFEEKVRDVDVVLDTVGKETAERAAGTVKKGGRFVTIVQRSGEEQCAAAGVTFISAGPGCGGPSEGDLLREVAKLATEGRIMIPVDRTYLLEQAVDAQNYSQAGHAQGKVVLVVDPKMALQK